MANLSSVQARESLTMAMSHGKRPELRKATTLLSSEDRSQFCSLETSDITTQPCSTQALPGNQSVVVLKACPLLTSDMSSTSRSHNPQSSAGSSIRGYIRRALTNGLSLKVAELGSHPAKRGVRGDSDGISDSLCAQATTLLITG